MAMKLASKLIYRLSSVIFLWPSITYLNEKIKIVSVSCYTGGDPIFILRDFDAINSIGQRTSYSV